LGAPEVRDDARSDARDKNPGDLFDHPRNERTRDFLSKILGH
jgi:hypothetical protein